MQTLEFERLFLGRVALDFCFPCQVVWFDEHESTELAPGGMIEVFKAFDEHRAPTRNPLPELLDCPRCNSRLALTHDLQRTTHFAYYRCDWGHGRLTPFVQFLLEKNFVRPLSGSELVALKARVRSIQCSNCGAPIDLQHDTVCPYCRSPLAILDPEAVGKALRELNSAEVQRKTIDVDRLADALTMPPGYRRLAPRRERRHRRRLDRRPGRGGHSRRRRVVALARLSAIARRPGFFPGDARRHKIRLSP